MVLVVPNQWRKEHTHPKKQTEKKKHEKNKINKINRENEREGE